MKTMWRRTCGLALAPLVMASAVACGNGSDQASEGTTLRVIVNITPNLTEKYWNDLFDTYEKSHPGVTVKLELTGTISADAKLRQDLAAGDPPDVAQQITPTADTASLFADLSDQPWTAKTPLADQYAIDGKHYVVGVGEQIQSLVFYNKAVFEKAGIDATSIRTMDQFTAAMGSLKGAGSAAADGLPVGHRLPVLDDGRRGCAHRRPRVDGQAQRRQDLLRQERLPALPGALQELDRQGLSGEERARPHLRGRADGLPERQVRDVHHGFVLRAGRRRREEERRDRRVHHADRRDLPVRTVRQHLQSVRRGEQVAPQGRGDRVREVGDHRPEGHQEPARLRRQSPRGLHVPDVQPRYVRAEGSGQGPVGDREVREEPADRRVQR